MTTHIFEIGYTPGEIISDSKLFVPGVDDVFAVADSSLEATNRHGRYSPTYSNIPAGRYMQEIYIADVGARQEFYTSSGIDEIIFPWTEQDTATQILSLASIIAALTTSNVGIDILLERISSVLTITNGKVTATNGSLSFIDNITITNTSLTGAPKFTIGNVVYLVDSAANGYLEPQTVIGVKLTKRGWVYTVLVGYNSKELLHGDRSRFVSQNELEFTEDAFTDKASALVMMHNYSVEQLLRIDSQIEAEVGV